MPKKEVDNKCPVCGGKVVEFAQSYRCAECPFKVNKTISGTPITEDVIKKLCQENRSDLMSFTSKADKRFNAYLAVVGDQITFRFPSQLNEESYIRVESWKPGVVDINVSGPYTLQETIKFNLAPTRLAECYGAVIACRLLLYNGYPGQVKISANSREFVAYALGQKKPSTPEIREAIDMLWEQLPKFDGWEITYDHKQAVDLKGGTTENRFPRGIFPWLKKIDVITTSQGLVVKLPADPVVRTQFQSSLRRATEEKGDVIVPVTARKVVMAWLSSVRSNLENTMDS